MTKTHKEKRNVGEIDLTCIKRKWRGASEKGEKDEEDESDKCDHNTKASSNVANLL